MRMIRIFLIVICVFSCCYMYGQTHYDSVSVDTVRMFNATFVQKTYFNDDKIIEKELYDGHDSKLRSRYYYKNGKKDGLENEWWDNGKLKVSVIYNEGIPVKEWKEWYKNGNLSYEVKFDTTFNVGISYYDDGTIKSKEIMDKSFALSGKCIYWCKNGQITKEVDFQSKVWENYSTHYCNGQLKSLGTIVDYSYKSGKWEEWYQNGKVKVEGTYRKRSPGSQLPEIKVGEWKSYYSNGNLASDEYYTKHGEKTGICKYYSEVTGKLMREINYNKRRK